MVGFQVMPRLSADEYAELEQSIIDNGVQVPISVAPDGTIIDGHHRDEIARKHSLHCPRVTAQGSDEKLRGLAFSLNLHRRHLTREQKREIVAASIKADPQLSDREHGRRTGVSKNTAASVRDALSESGQVDHFSERIDPRTGNATQPATKPRATFTCWACEQQHPADQQTDTDDGPICGDCLDIYDRIDVTEPEVPTPIADADLAPEPPQPAPEPAAPRRRPITDQAHDAGWELRKTVERIQRITTDDRFEGAKEKVTPQLRGHLTDAIASLQAVLDRINNSQGV